MSRRVTPRAGAPTQSRIAPVKVKYDTPIPPEKLRFNIDVCGAEASGKSHFARTFGVTGGICWLETPPEWGKADVILNKFKHVYNDDAIVKLKRVKTFDDIRQVARDAIADDEISTVVIDSGTHIRSLAAKEWMAEESARKGKEVKAVYPSTQWQYPNMKIDDVISEIKEGNKFLVVTNRLHDEWIGDDSTGRQIRHGHKSFTYDFHIVLEIVWGIRNRAGKVFCKDHRFARVMKNASWGIDEDTNMNYGKPYLFNVTYKGVVEELLVPWGPHHVRDSLNKCAEEAVALFDPPKVEKPKAKKKGPKR